MTMTNIPARIALGAPLSEGALRTIERKLNLDHGKWDTHVGDERVLSPQPLLLHRDEWRWLCGQAESAAQEMFAFEEEIVSSKGLQQLIGMPRKLRKLVSRNASGNVLRTLRFDFHPTAAGWAMSEVNSDVPGGFGEATFLPILYERYTVEASLPTSPLSLWADAMQSELNGGRIALLYAPGFLEDEQVVRVLARALRDRGFSTYLIQSPAALEWKQNYASLRRGARVGIDAVIRFYQAEWLSQLPTRTGWKNLFGYGDRTPVINPAISAISESKRLGLCFRHLAAGSNTWRALSPECREPSEIAAEPQEDWVLKATYSNTGDEVHLGGDMSFPDWSELLRRAKSNPSCWVAQRRFETLSLPSVVGPVRPCVGVFVIGGRAAGAYVRLSRTQVTDAHALEAPLFIMSREKSQ
jgi:glutathionylspermidine synthase